MSLEKQNCLSANIINSRYFLKFYRLRNLPFVHLANDFVQSNLQYTIHFFSVYFLEMYVLTQCFTS